jgi:hypothetical protein
VKSTEPVPAVPAAPGPTTSAPADAQPDSGLRETAETWSPEEPVEADEAREPATDDDELAILQALERGEIGVDEAAKRLERVRR